MSLGKTWYTVEEATEKFGVAQELMLMWCTEGIRPFTKLSPIGQL
jgi:hypothetical protein